MLPAVFRVLTLGYSEYSLRGTPSTHALQAGVCYRLYSARTAAALPAHQPAEIHRIGLEQVCLQVRAIPLEYPSSTPRVPLRVPPRVPLVAPAKCAPRVPLGVPLEYP